MYTPQYKVDDLLDEGYEVIDSFTGEYDFLSNFYSHPIFFRGHWYPTTEHAFHSQKNDSELYQVKLRTLAEILYFHQCMNHARVQFDHIKFNELTPGQAKRAGRGVELRKDWEEIKIPLMDEVTDIKFNDPVLGRKLFNTGTAVLIEGNTWGDQFWGTCMGEGRNELGQCLMRKRTKLSFFRYVETTDLETIKHNYEKEGRRI
jgi:hypothetical protein